MEPELRAPDPMKSHPIPVLTISTLSQLTQIAQPFLASLWITFSQHSKKGVFPWAASGRALGIAREEGGRFDNGASRREGFFRSCLYPKLSLNHGLTGFRSATFVRVAEQ